MQRYWHNGKKPIPVYTSGNEKDGGTFHYELDGKKVDTNKITYILFKNADNGSGRIKNKEQYIENYTCIEYHFEDTQQKEQVCRELIAQLDSDYVVAVPKNNNHCIIIFMADRISAYADEFKENYYAL